MSCNWLVPVRHPSASSVDCVRRFRSVRIAGLLAILFLLPPLAVAQSGSGRTKQSLVDAIRGENGRAELSTQTTAEVRAFLDDKSKPARDRVEVTITFEQAKLKRRSFATRDAHLTAHTAHAEELMREFPDQPEGYGYLLSLAKGQDGAKARRMAATLLASPAPERIKQGAQRVLNHLDLEGKELRAWFTIADVPDWSDVRKRLDNVTAQNPGIRESVRRLAATERNLTFIGINLDADPTAARTIAVGLPGTQFYDGGGLDGPLARQLQLTMPVALYLVDAGGVVRNVDAYHDPAGSFAQLKGGKRK